MIRTDNRSGRAAARSAQLAITVCGAPVSLIRVTACGVRRTSDAYRYGGFTVPRFASSAGRESIQVHATVDRAETDNSIDTCTGMPIAPNPPLDCGRRQLPWFLTLAPAYRRAGGIWLGTDTRRPQDDPFHACYATLFTWPTIQDHDPNGDRTWFGAVPNNLFFSARARRITVHAHYTATARGTNLTNGLKGAAVQLDWTLSLGIPSQPGCS